MRILTTILLLASLCFSQTLGGSAKVGGQGIVSRVTSGGGGGGPFVNAVFTAGSDTNLQAYPGTEPGEAGATFTLHPSYSGTTIVNASLDRIFLNTSAAAGYYASGVPPNANYCVQADFLRVTQMSTNVSIILGMDTSADTGVLLRANDNATTFVWETIDRTSGSNSVLNTSVSNVPTVGGSAVTMKICRSGTAITVFANGVQDTTLNSTTSITATGRAGIRMSAQATSTTGIHLDNFSAQ